MGRQRTRIAVFGPTESPVCRAVADALRARRAQAVLVDTRGPIPITFTESTLSIAGHSVDALSGAYVHAIPPRQPLLRDIHEGRAPRALDVDAWQEGVARGHAARDLVVVALDALVARGLPVVNPPQGGAVVQRKLADLALARALGLSVPETHVSADRRACARFVARVKGDGGRVVTKPVRGGAHARRADAANGLDVPGPVLLQREVAGHDARVLLLDGDARDRVLLSIAMEKGRALDGRSTRAYRAGRAPWRSAALDDATRDRLLSLLRARGLTFAAVDGVWSPERGFVFLEMNTAPVFVELAERCGVDVAGALADRLLSHRAP